MKLKSTATIFFCHAFNNASVKMFYYFPERIIARSCIHTLIAPYIFAKYRIESAYNKLLHGAKTSLLWNFTIIVNNLGDQYLRHKYNAQGDFFPPETPKACHCGLLEAL